MKSLCDGTLAIRNGWGKNITLLGTNFWVVVTSNHPMPTKPSRIDEKGVVI